MNRREILAGVGSILAFALPETFASAQETAKISRESIKLNMPGFSFAEAYNLAFMCDYIYGRGTPKPDGWDIVFDCPQLMPLANKWQLWKSTKLDNAYAIIIRGTVDQSGSVLEDLFSLLITAKGSINSGKYSIPYNFSNNPSASVHAGFALGSLVLLHYPLVGILDQLKRRAIPSNSRVFVAGHSQGAAVATLIRSYLQFSNNTQINEYQYKSYFFAQPKPGNEGYSADFDSNFSNGGNAFRITNSLDWVPQVPLTIELLSDLSIPNPFTNKNTLSTSNMQTLIRGQQELIGYINNISINKLKKIATFLLQKKYNISSSILTPLPFTKSLNFHSSGRDMLLIGNACKPGPGITCDAWYQHHLSTYETLLKEQLGHL